MNADEPRDEHGRWTASSVGGKAAQATAKAHAAEARYHRQAALAHAQKGQGIAAAKYRVMAQHHEAASNSYETAAHLHDEQQPFAADAAEQRGLARAKKASDYARLNHLTTGGNVK